MTIPHTSQVSRRLLQVGLLLSTALVVDGKSTLDPIGTSAETQVPVYYNNPVGGTIIMGDPCIARYGDTYYLTGTTATSTGFSLWTSKNLVDWASHGYVFLKGETTWARRDLWAPELFERNGKYYLVYSGAANTTDGYRVCLAVADEPTGPYLDLYTPWCDPGYPVIDADVFFDTDGTAYLYYAKVGTTTIAELPPAYRFKLVAEIWGVKLKADLSGPDGEPTQLVVVEQDWEKPLKTRSWANEGSFVFKHGDYYYMTYSANYYADKNYGIGYATASSPLGKWTKALENPILQAVDALGVSGPGHNAFTLAPDNQTLLMVYHAHTDPKNPSGNRSVNVDPVVFEPTDGGPDKLKVLGPTRSPELMPGATVPAQAFFPTAAYGGEQKWKSATLGWISITSFPWVWIQQQKAWGFISGSSESDFWLWDISLGWLWTHPDIASFYYSADKADFLYYFPESNTPRWFYSYKDTAWIPVGSF